MQFSSDTSHPELASSPRGAESFPKLTLFWQHTDIWLTGYKFEGSHNSLSFENSLEWFTAMKVIIYYFSFIIKAIGQEEPNEKMHGENFLAIFW